MANCNLVNNVVAISVQMAAEVGLSQTKFILDSIEAMRSRVRKDHWTSFTLLWSSDETGRELVNSIVKHLFRLAYSNVRMARILNETTLEVVLTDNTKILIQNPAQREQEDEDRLPW